MHDRFLTTRRGERLPLSAVGFGCAPLGNMYRAIPEAEAQATLDAAFGAGIRYFDTAPLYGLGLSEQRLGAAVARYGRDGLVLSSKVGRLLEDCAPDEMPPDLIFRDVPARRMRYDYSYDAVMRSLEASCARLGTDRIDILLIHDVDIFTHGSRDAADRCIGEVMAGGYRALDALRAAGTVRAIGAGVNEWEICERLAREGDFDCFLLAGRYTLLEQAALETFLPLCVARGIGLILGGPYNSGILATGAVPGARYNYAAAPEEVLDRVRRLQAACDRHGVPLAHAALQFALAHPAVISVIPGAAHPAEIAQTMAALESGIPAGLWAELKADGLLRGDAPVPDAVPAA